MKTKNIIGWILTALLGALFIFSAFGKFTVNDKTLQMAATMGFTASGLKFLGVVEIASFILFAIPRTGILGTLLLTAYIGGAIATHLEHNMPPLMPPIVEAVIWITAVLRFPELSRRLVDKEKTFDV